jgi:hypothetical protein
MMTNIITQPRAICTILVLVNWICSVYMGNACITV